MCTHEHTHSSHVRVREKPDGQTSDLIRGGVAWLREAGCSWSSSVKRAWKGQPQAPAEYFIKSHSCVDHEDGSERAGGRAGGGRCAVCWV